MFTCRFSNKNSFQDRKIIVKHSLICISALRPSAWARRRLDDTPHGWRNKGKIKTKHSGDNDSRELTHKKNDFLLQILLFYLTNYFTRENRLPQGFPRRKKMVAIPRGS